MKTFAISDIHGCYKELMALYVKLPINPEEDRMIFLGDYIDRGPDSKKVVQQLLEWKQAYPHWVVLLGNHEDFMVDSLFKKRGDYGDDPYSLWMANGGKVTLDSYLPIDWSDYERATAGNLRSLVPPEHLEFLATLPRYFEDDNYIYVHGGVKPGKTPAETRPYDLIWIRDEFINSTYDWGKKVIFGHTTDWSGRHNPKKDKFAPIIKENKIGIDTAVCQPTRNGLTALELPAEKFYFQEAING